MISPETILKISSLTIANNIRKHNSIFGSNNNETNNLGLLVANMNLSISRKKIHGIVGESGSGKTLTMKAVLGLIEIDPGIIRGSIHFHGRNDIVTQILGPKKKLGPLRSKATSIPISFKSAIELAVTEYFQEYREDNKYYLKHNHLVPGSVELFLMNNNFCIKKINSSVHVLDSLAWVELDPKSDMNNTFMIVRYKIKIDNLGKSLKKQTERALNREKLRGDKISMILQDPQTFLNPYWTIGEQLSNILRLRRRKRGRAEFAERNYSLMIVGDSDDYPVKLTWEKEKLKEYLRYADFHVNGKALNMLELSSHELAASIEVDLGMQTVGKKFKAAIHLLDFDSSITVSWDSKYLSEKIIGGTFLFDSRENRKSKNMLSDSSILLKDPKLNDKGEILVELLLITEKNVELRSTLTVSTKNYKKKLIFGLEKGASDGIDSHKGEIPEIIKAQSDYSGFLLDDPYSEVKILSLLDIKSPVNMYCQFPNITITPKSEKRMDDFIGSIEISSHSDSKRLLSFGYSHELKKHSQNLIDRPLFTEGSFSTEFEAGFIVENKSQLSAYSASDIRSIDLTADVDSEVSSLLSKLDLDDRNNEFRNKLPRDVSGGQSQQVMISLAMASKPEILIADEPTTGLDVSKQREVIQLFQQYKSQGRTIILISHDMNFINHLADNYTIIYAGYDVEHISSSVLRKKKFLHPYTERLFEIATADEKEKFDAIDKDIPDPYKHHQDGCPFFERCHRYNEIGTLSEAHICNSIFPPLVNASLGTIIENHEIDNRIHAVRCWLYVSPVDHA